jgi:hypothetical protein
MAFADRIAVHEKANLGGLKKTGFKLDFGLDGSDMYRKYITGDVPRPLGSWQ